MDFNTIKSYFKIKENAGRDKCKAICPAHPDKEASLSIKYDSKQNKTLVFCHAGCETRDILSAVGLKISDLFDKELVTDSSPKEKGKNIEAVYQYKDKDGTVVFEKVRFKPKKFSQRRTVDGFTVWGLEKGTYYETFPGSNHFSSKERDNAAKMEVEATEPVIYNLPAVIEGITHNQTIYIVEGEKDVDNVNKLGLIGTCNFDGASKSKQKPKWRESYNETFRGAKVVLIPDNDDPGRSHMENIAENLYGIAESIKIIKLDGLPEKGDISDWLAADHTKDDLLTIVQRTTVWSKNEKPTSEYETTYGLGIYAWNNCYGKYVKDEFQPFSNFVINVKSVIQADNEVYINAVFLNSLGERMEKTFLTEAFDSIKQLRAMLNNPYFSFWGTDKELQAIRNMIFSKEHAHKIGVKCIGLHKINGMDMFVSTDGVIDRDGNKVDNVVMLDDYVETTTNLLSVDPITADELKQIAKDLFNFNRLGITATVIGYAAGTFLAEKLREKNIKYNHLMVEGPPGSGKSQTVETVITGILGVGREDILDIGQCTNFALTKSSSSSNTIPLILNEYKPNKIGPIKVNLVSTIMRNSYDNSGVRKGTANLKKNKEFNYRAPMIVVGESGMSETANVERSLKVMFYKKSHSPDRFLSMSSLKENRSLLNKLGRSLLNIALKKDSKELAEKHKKLFMQMQKVAIRDDRIKESISNCILGLALVRDVFKSLGLDFEAETGIWMKDLVTEVQKTAAQDLLMGAEGSKNVIDLTLETLNRMAINSVLVARCDYDTVIDKDGDLVLRLNYKAFYDRFLKYCKDNKIEHEILQLESFEQQISNMDYCKISKHQVRFKVKFETGESKNFRAMVLYADKLRERNLDVEFMVDEATSERALKLVGLCETEDKF